MYQHTRLGMFLLTFQTKGGAGYAPAPPIFLLHGSCELLKQF
jgi:hypothetical protein